MQAQELWRALALVNLYRYTLVLALLMGAANHPLRSKWEQGDQTGFFVALAAILFSAICWSLIGRRHWAGFHAMARMQCLLDACLVLWLNYTSPADAGLGVLILMPLLQAGLFLPVAQAMVMAFCICFLFIVSAYGKDPVIGNELSSHGMVALVGMAVTFASSFMATRGRYSEKLADERAGEVQRLARLNALIIQHLDQGIMVLSPEGELLLVNHIAHDWLKLPENTRPGMRIDQQCPALNEQWRCWLVNPADSFLHWHYAGADLRLHFMRLEVEDVPGVLILIEDMALVHKQAQQMKLAALGHLTGGIAHQMRNPLAIVLQAARMLDSKKNTGFNDRQRHLIYLILRNTSKANQTISDILKLSSQSESATELFDLVLWLRTAVAIWKAEYSESGMELGIESPPDGLYVQADSSHLQHILGNLIGNSERHGKIVDHPLKVMLRCGRNDHGNVFLEVQDNGPGVGEQARIHLFEPFFTTSPAGSGLGLFLCRQLCEASQIHMEYHSVAGSGACFRLVFPTPQLNHEIRIVAQPPIIAHDQDSFIC